MRQMRVGQQFFDRSGNPLNGGKLHFYARDSLREEDTYSDEAESTANDNPVVLGSDGRPPNDIYTSSRKKIILTDSAGVQQAYQNNALYQSGRTGTFTPVLDDLSGNGPATTSEANGYYTEIGKQTMFIVVEMTLTSLNGMTNIPILTGLPEDPATAVHIIKLWATGCSITAKQSLFFVTDSTRDGLTLRIWDQTSGYSDATSSALTNSFQFVAAGFYRY